MVASLKTQFCELNLSHMWSVDDPAQAREWKKQLTVDFRHFTTFSKAVERAQTKLKPVIWAPPNPTFPYFLDCFLIINYKKPCNKIMLF